MSRHGIHRIAVSTPFAVGPVNCWLIEDEPLTLVDTGPNTGSALDELALALGELGYAVGDLGRILVTHQHVDHEGLVSILARRSGAEVVALDLLAPVLEDLSAWSEADDQLAERLMLAHGIPREVALALRSVSRVTRGFGAPADVDTRVPDGAELTFGSGRTLRVHHRPGHSPTDTVFHDPERRVLISGDHLLAHISSNPVLHKAVTGDPDARPHALADYLVSMRATRDMDAVDLVLPGHGDPLTDHRRVIDDRLRMHERRAEKILRLLSDEGPRTAYEVATALWGSVAITQAFLALSEVLGHLDVLATRGTVTELVDGDLHRFAAA